MDLKYYLRKSKDVHGKDVLSIFPMFAALIVSPFCHKKYKTVWAVSERPAEARDNGYHFFKYMRECHPEQSCVYVCDRRCEDYQKVRNLGVIVQPGSIEHWLLYFFSPYLISSQKFAPNGYMITLLERLKLFKPKHVFLQHGITKDVPDFLLASHRNAAIFIAGAKPEYDFMRENFGYPEGTMQYTGFARFDALHDFSVNKNQILIMPTWRKWLRFQSEEHSDAKMDLASSEYIKCWKELLCGDEFIQLMDQFQLKVLFYPHPNMRNIVDFSELVNKRIQVVDPNQQDLQELLKSSALLITDYSSVFFDMVYMKKPVIFYQFDEEQFRKYHYKQGWFDYHQTSFGRSCGTAKEVITELQYFLDNDFSVSKEYLDEHKKLFPIYDQKNCERIYQLLAGT